MTVGSSCMLADRARSSARVRLERIDQHCFIAYGSSGEYLVDLREMSCECPDFRYRCGPGDIPCKHLIAALRENNQWDAYLAGLQRGPAS